MKYVKIVLMLSFLCIGDVADVFASVEMTSEQAYDILSRASGLEGANALSSASSLGAIRKAYHQAALRYHPDKNLGNALSGQAFNDIQAAYDRLIVKDQSKDSSANGQRFSFEQQRALKEIKSVKWLLDTKYPIPVERLSSAQKQERDKIALPFDAAQSAYEKQDYATVIDLLEPFVKQMEAVQAAACKQAGQRQNVSNNRLLQQKIQAVQRYYDTYAVEETIDKNQAIQFVKDGDVLLKKLYSSVQYVNPLQNYLNAFNIDFAQSQRAYLNAIVKIHWAIFAAMLISLIDGTVLPSIDGTIVIEDRDNRLFQFLYQYVQSVNDKISAKQAKPQSVFSDNCYAYMRAIKQHFPEFKNIEGYEQYGIDMRFGISKKKYDDLQSLLAHSRQHIIFGKVGKDLLFLQTQPYGLCGSDSLRNEILGTEHVTKNVLEAWTMFSKTIKVSIKKLYIKDMYGAAYAVITHDTSKIVNPNLKLKIESVIQSVSPTQKEAAKRFLQYIETIMGYKHLKMRRGRETILTQPDFLP